MLAIAVHASLLIFYGSFVLSFGILLFIKFRIILIIWRFIYKAVGFRVWEAFRPDDRYKIKFKAFRLSAPFTTLMQKWRRVGVWVLGSFALFFCATALVYWTAPETLKGSWLFG